MAHILVIDDMPIIREPIAANLAHAGHSTVCSSNGKEGMEVAKKLRPAVILLDLEMPEMDGVTFLKLLRADPDLSHTPVIILTASGDKNRIVQIAKVGVQGYLLKTKITLKALQERIDSCLVGSTSNKLAPSRPVPTQQKRESRASGSVPAAPVEIPKLLTREQCIERAKNALQAKTLSGVVAQVISLAASPRGDMTQLAGLISRDPMLAARVLQAANSAAYLSSRGTVTTIPDAVRQIGCSTVRNIAAALGIFEAMPTTQPDGFNPIRCWQHSFAVATLCERLAKQQSEEAAGVAYLVGLCHDLGEILFYTQFGKEYAQPLKMHEQTGKPLAELERIMLGMTHGQLVAIILRCMNLPDAIRQPIEVHHALEKPQSQTSSHLARILHVADSYANGLLLAASASSPVNVFSADECKETVGEANPSITEIESIRSEIYGLTGLLARLSTTEEAALMAPLFKRRDVKLWITRDPGLSNFDPVVTALQSMCDVHIENRLPGASEVSDCGGVAVITRTTTTAGFDATFVSKLGTDVVIPLLWLSHSGDSVSDLKVQEPTPSILPISLEDLYDFVDRSAKHASQQAAA